MFWVIGSLNVDLVVQLDRFPLPGETLHGSDFATFLGGKGGNQAMALARLGGQPNMVGCVGDDDFGVRYREALQEAGAGTEHVPIVSGLSTGTALIEVEKGGQNRIVIVAGANAHLGTAEVDRAVAAMQPGDVVLLQLESPHDVVWYAARAAHEKGAVVILDPAPAAPVPQDVLPFVDWITPNEHEAATITGVDTARESGLKEAAAALRAAGVRNVVVKAGGAGAWLCTAGTPEPQLVPGFKVPVVDTTAAGDSFNGGLAWALAAGQAPAEAVRTANAVGALAVTGMGAQTAMPTAAQVEELLRRL